VLLPVFGVRLAAMVLKDAIAGRFAWDLLGELFAAQVYPRLFGEQPDAAWERRRTELAGDAVREDGDLHDRIGWAVFLRELLGWSDIGEADEPPRALASPAGEPATERVEVSLPLPTFTGVQGALTIDLTIGGAHTLFLVVEPAEGIVTAEQIRAAVMKQGLELARVAVREALLGYTGDPGVPLRERLRLQVETAPDLAPLEVLGGAAGPAEAQRQLAAIGRDLLDAGATIIGAPRGTAPSELVRRSELPVDLAAEMIQRLQPGQFAGRLGAGEAPRAFALPDLVNGPPVPEPASGPSPAPARGDLSALYGRHFFERLFSGGPDPWKYTSPYEQRKYEQTLALLPDDTRGKVLEIGCAEGHFTVQLAPLVEHLHATDLADLALERAAQRCAAFDNVSYAQLDILNDPLEGAYDAIVCSELLYYMGDLASLKRVGAKIASALAPGGVLVTAHANLVVDEPEATGFDWGMAYGAKRIGETFSSVPGLEFEHEFSSSLYRIQRFRKRRRRHLFARSAGPCSTSQGDYAMPEPHVAQHILWNGGEVAPVVQQVATDRLPILMYHAVSDHGPEPLARWRVTPAMFDAQLRYLREAGFTPTTFDEWRSAREHRIPLPGRRVIITFDDVYADFGEAALPILRRHGFPATLFVPSGQIGGRAEWDDWAGAALPLLDLDGLKRARDAGMRFGAHGHSHRRLADLPPRQVLDELWRSRVTLEDALAIEVDAFAYPFGSHDEIAERLAGACFYRHAVLANDSLSELGEADLALSRMEVRGGEDLAAFIRRMPE
jgi:peptidoglycan/xylan/chitin deacetylase (PgdA/CDA1 family)